MEIYLDKNKKAPVIKAVNGVQNGPLTFDFLIDETEHFKAAGFPYSRLHDTELLYGSGDFVNIHCIFPDMTATLSGKFDLILEPDTLVYAEFLR